MPMTREEVAEQERDALHPGWLRVANMGILLSGALLLASFIGSFVMWMNAREDVQQESAGVYHASNFYVLQAYWQKGKTDSLRNGSGLSATQAFARGTVEGREEWMDLVPYLTFVPKDEAATTQAVPPGTMIPVYYNPQARGEYRVRVLSAKLPAEASRHIANVTLRYGIPALVTTATMLLAFRRLRRFAIGTASSVCKGQLKSLG